MIQTMPHRTLDEYLKQTTHTITKQQATKSKYRITGFYKETEFQKTPIGKIPKEWQVLRLRELFTYIKGKKPKNLIKEEKEGYLPYLTTDYLRTGVPSNYAKHEKDTTIVDDNDILLLWDGSNAGEFFLGKKGILASTMVKLVPKINEISTLFYFYYLKLVENRLKSLTKGTGIPHVEKSVFENLQLIKPPLEEQWGIAEVLSSVDEAIGATERLIGRLERLKRGLMQELLTKGIGHREYKQTPIGKIPKEWQIVKLSRIAKIIMGQSPPSSTYNEEGIGLPFLQGKAEFGRMYPKPVMYTSKSIKIAEEGDLLISVRAPVGDVNIAPFKLCIGRGLASIRFNRDRANTLFYFYYFQFAKPRLEAMGKGSTFKAITKKDLENLLVPLPPLDEQNRIASTLKAVDNWISTEEKRKEKLERLKRGLMELLLTGKVRVRVERLGGEEDLPGSGGGAGS